MNEQNKKDMYFEDYEEAEELEHPWGRTITESDTILFSTLAMEHNPVYFNSDYAGELSYEDMIIHPIFILGTAISMSAAEQATGVALGYDNVKIINPMYPGETLYVNSKITSTRESQSRPHQGIVEWRVTGFNQDDVPVIEFDRQSLVDKYDDEENGGGQ